MSQNAPILIKTIPTPETDATEPVGNLAGIVTDKAVIKKFLENVGPQSNQLLFVLIGVQAGGEGLRKAYANHPELIPGIDIEEAKKKGITFAKDAHLLSFPEHYVLTAVSRGGSSNHVDKYVYGHPSKYETSFADEVSQQQRVSFTSRMARDR
ncbi:hypothetical protein HDU97_000434 [Phlyctochytrium planicorne]|nr:hypothetical protein HDU97_000434 [Phlyctochytrium planicorne]